jgi:hypothetical protein
MGYNTSYEFDYSDNINQDDLAQKMFDILSADLDKTASWYEESLKYLHQMVDNLVYDKNYYGRWYSYFSDMKKISSLYPDETFGLSGRGDESDDVWTAFFSNGKGFKYNDKMYIRWLINKFGGNHEALFDEFVNSNLK